MTRGNVSDDESIENPTSTDEGQKFSMPVSEEAADGGDLDSSIRDAE